MIVKEGIARGLLAYFISLAAKVQRLYIVGLDLEDQFKTILCLLLLVHADVAARAE